MSIGAIIYSVPCWGLISFRDRDKFFSLSFFECSREYFLAQEEHLPKDVQLGLFSYRFICTGKKFSTVAGLATLQVQQTKVLMLTSTPHAHIHRIPL
jgi:hypothetical protein